jgi:putative addiction module component (TIGR02574 family)
MGNSAQKLYEEAMRLDPKERAELTGLLIESLEPESESGVEEAWIAEVERRVAELDSGAVKTIPWDELRSKLYAKLNAAGSR